MLTFSDDVSEDFDEGGPRIGHVWIETAFFLPELTDPRALLGLKAGHDAVNVRLMAASLIAVWKGSLVDPS